MVVIKSGFLSASQILILSDKLRLFSPIRFVYNYQHCVIYAAYSTHSHIIAQYNAITICVFPSRIMTEAIAAAMVVIKTINNWGGGDGPSVVSLFFHIPELYCINKNLPYSGRNHQNFIVYSTPTL